MSLSNFVVPKLDCQHEGAYRETHKGLLTIWAALMSAAQNFYLKGRKGLNEILREPSHFESKQALFRFFLFCHCFSKRNIRRRHLYSLVCHYHNVRNFFKPINYIIEKNITNLYLNLMIRILIVKKYNFCWQSMYL